MNLFWYKIKLTIFITFIIFIVIFLTWSSFFLVKYYKHYITVSNKLQQAKNKIIKLNHKQLDNKLNKLSNAQIAFTLWNIVDTKTEKKPLTYKFLNVNYALIKNNYDEILYQNFDNSLCWINYKCLSFKKNNYNFIIWEKIENLNLILYNIFIFSFFVFAISILLSLWIYLSIDFITKPVEKNIEFMKNFVNNAWHELKTPLANINLSSQILKKKQTYDNEIVNDIIQESSKLWELIDSLLNLSILSKTKIQTEVNIRNIIDDILQKYSKQIKAKQITVNKQINIETVYGDKNHFQILLKNIITNAIKYNKQNGQINIIINKWEIIIQNTWNKISKEDSKKIFDIFYRINNIQEEWYWLGLAIVKKITEVNHWKIKVKSESWLNTFKIKL